MLSTLPVRAQTSFSPNVNVQNIWAVSSRRIIFYPCVLIYNECNRRNFVAERWIFSIRRVRQDRRVRRIKFVPAAPLHTYWKEGKRHTHSRFTEITCSYLLEHTQEPTHWNGFLTVRLTSIRRARVIAMHNYNIWCQNNFRVGPSTIHITYMRKWRSPHKSASHFDAAQMKYYICRSCSLCVGTYIGTWI